MVVFNGEAKDWTLGTVTFSTMSIKYDDIKQCRVTQCTIQEVSKVTNSHND